MVSSYVKHRSSLSYLSLLILFSALMYGCSTPAYRAHPEFEVRVKSISKPALMPPDVKVYESLPGGMVVLRDDWSTLGRENLQRAIIKSFREKNCKVKLLTPDLEIQAELAEIQSLYKVVNKSIRLQAYGRTTPSHAPANFDYSIGSLENILQILDADAVIFVCAIEKVSNGKSMAVVNLAIADSSGTIIWYSVGGSRDKHDLIKTIGAAELVENLMVSFPKVGG